MERWDDLKLFLAVLREGSLTQAGEALGVNQSTVSRRLAALEDDLGTRLFDRTPDGMRPTRAGEQLLPHAELAESAVIDAERALMSRDQALEGTVRLAVADAFAALTVAPRLPELFERHPGIRLELLAGPRVVDLTRREADVAVRFVRPTHGDLVFKRLFTSPYGVFATEGYLAGRTVETLDDLDWITWIDELAMLPEAAWFAEHVRAVPRLRVDTALAGFNAALAGAGAILAAVAFATFVEGVRQVPTDRPMPPDVSIYLVTHRALRDVARVRAVWDFMEEVVMGVADEAKQLAHVGHLLTGRD